MPAADAAADRKHPLAEDGQQQQDAAGEAPSRFHEHQRRDVRVPADVAKPLDQVGEAGEREDPVGRGAGRGVESYLVRAMKKADAKNDARVDDERDVAAGQRRHQAADRCADRQHRRPHRARQRIGRHQLFRPT